MNTIGGRRPRRAMQALFWGLLGLNVLLRTYLAILPGYAVDLAVYKEWAVGTAQSGISSGYDIRSMDYPPVYLYPMYVAGKLYFWLEAPAPGTLPDTATLTALIKTPHVLFDLATGVLIFFLVGRWGLWGPSRAGPGWGALAMMLYVWNPGVIWNSGYWGQPDAVHTFFAVAALAAACRQRIAASGGLLAASALSKPLGAIFVPWLAWVSWARRGWGGVALLAVGGFAASALIFGPFIWDGRMGTVLPLVLLSVDLMPVTSANAHNLWWILGPWRSTDAAVLGPLTSKHLGQGMFLLAYLGVLWRSRAGLVRTGTGPEAYRATVFLGAAAVATSFFYLSTHMHENHLYMAIALLLVVAGRSRLNAALFVACSAAVFANGFLHDIELPYRLPGILGAASGTLDPHLQRPFTWLQLVGSFLDSLVVSFVAIGTYVAVWRGER